MADNTSWWTFFSRRRNDSSDPLFAAIQSAFSRLGDREKEALNLIEVPSITDLRRIAGDAIKARIFPELVGFLLEAYNDSVLFEEEEHMRLLSFLEDFREVPPSLIDLDELAQRIQNPEVFLHGTFILPLLEAHFKIRFILIDMAGKVQWFYRELSRQIVKPKIFILLYYREGENPPYQALPFGSGDNLLYGFSRADVPPKLAEMCQELDLAILE